MRAATSCVSIEKIYSRTAWIVDPIELHLQDGVTLIYGDNGGESQNHQTKFPDEHICAVEQRNYQVGHLGNALVFYLCSGRKLAIDAIPGNSHTVRMRR